MFVDIITFLTCDTFRACESRALTAQKHVAERLRELIDSKGVTLKAISTELGINYDWLRRVVSRGLSHRTQQTDKNLLPLCDYLGVDPDTLMQERKYRYSMDEAWAVFQEDYPHHYWLICLFSKRFTEPDDLIEYFRNRLIYTRDLLHDYGNETPLDRLLEVFANSLERKFTIDFEFER